MKFEIGTSSLNILTSVSRRGFSGCLVACTSGTHVFQLVWPRRRYAWRRSSCGWRCCISKPTHISVYNSTHAIPSYALPKCIPRVSRDPSLITNGDMASPEHSFLRLEHAPKWLKFGWNWITSNMHVHGVMVNVRWMPRPETWIQHLRTCTKAIEIIIKMLEICRGWRAWKPLKLEYIYIYIYIYIYLYYI